MMIKGLNYIYDVNKSKKQKQKCLLTLLLRQVSSPLLSGPSKLIYVYNGIREK